MDEVKTSNKSIKRSTNRTKKQLQEEAELQLLSLEKKKLELEVIKLEKENKLLDKKAEQCDKQLIVLNKHEELLSLKIKKLSI